MMIFSELQTMSRLFQSGAKSSSVDDAQRDIILNKGAEEVNRYGKLLKKDKKFNLVADQRTYLLSTIANDFETMDGQVLKIKDATANTDYRRLFPHTENLLDDKFPYWRTATSSKGRYYYQEGNEIGIYPPHNVAVSSGGWLFYIRKPLKMTEGDHYPFHIDGNQNIAMPGLDGFDYCILLYFKWKTAPILSKEGEQDPNESAFFREIDRQIKLKERRADIKADKRRQLIRMPRIRYFMRNGR